MESKHHLMLIRKLDTTKTGGKMLAYAQNFLVQNVHPFSLSYPYLGIRQFQEFSSRQTLHKRCGPYGSSKIENRATRTPLHFSTTQQ